jgi:hypothetical protein
MKGRHYRLGVLASNLRAMAGRNLLICFLASMFALDRSGNPLGRQSQSPVQQEGVAELLAIHRADRRAHFNHDVSAIVAELGPELLDVRNGQINRLSRDSVRAHFEAYFRTAKFSAWDDLEPPVVRVSQDGLVGWMVVRVRVAYDETTNPGQIVPRESIQSWMSAYQKLGGKWMLEAVTSTEEVPRPIASAAGIDWTRFGWDAGRSSASTAPTGITAANVGSLHRQQVAIDGTVDASAIYLSGVQVSGAAHDALFVTTSYGKTLAIDAAQGTVLWEFTPPGYDTWAGSARITNSTPVADPDRAFIYAASPDGHIEKLAVSDGHPVWSTAITLRPESEKIASPLNFWRGRVIAVTGGYIGDAPPYQGHVAVLDASSGRLEHVWNSLCSDRAGLIQPSSCAESGSAIWARAGAVIDSATEEIYVATGNGHWDGRTSWGDATLVLDRDATGLLANQTPTNTEELDAADLDVGSTAPVLLGTGYLAQGGKDGKIRLLDLSKMRGGTAHRGGEVQIVSTPSGQRLMTAPAVLHEGGTTWMFVADGGGTAAWTLKQGQLQSAWANHNAGTSPVVAGGLLYVYDPGGTLRTYEPETGQQVAAIPCGGGHWNSPIVVDGRIVLPEGSANRHETRGVLDIWRLP